MAAVGFFVNIYALLLFVHIQSSTYSAQSQQLAAFVSSAAKKDDSTIVDDLKAIISPEEGNRHSFTVHAGLSALSTLLFSLSMRGTPQRGHNPDSYRIS